MWPVSRGLPGAGLQGGEAPRGLRLVQLNVPPSGGVDREKLARVLALHYPGFRLDPSATTRLRITFFDPREPHHAGILEGLCELGGGCQNFNYARLGPSPDGGDYEIFVNEQSWGRPDGFFGPAGPAPQTQEDYRYGYMLPHELGHALLGLGHDHEDDPTALDGEAPIMRQQSLTPSEWAERMPPGMQPRRFRG